ncbi:MAG: carboxypeptidase regulatory-like domain-containing protein [Candidatus Riflebacteria bacterium]|nr:carboxypeptidase regulatory-like domain-containing protein [Candidatus Riflebacteria bacterium]
MSIKVKHPILNKALGVAFLLCVLFGSGLLVGFVQTKKIISSEAEFLPLTRSRMLKDLGRTLESLSLENGKIGSNGQGFRQTAVSFSDYIVDNEFEASLIETGLIKGFPNGKFNPDFSISRGEVFSILADIIVSFYPKYGVGSESVSTASKANTWLSEKLRILNKIDGIDKFTALNLQSDRNMAFSDWKKMIEAINKFIKASSESESQTKNSFQTALFTLRNRLAGKSAEQNINSVESIAPECIAPENIVARNDSADSVSSEKTESDSIKRQQSVEKSSAMISDDNEPSVGIKIARTFEAGPITDNAEEKISRLASSETDRQQMVRRSLNDEESSGMLGNNENVIENAIKDDSFENKEKNVLKNQVVVSGRVIDNINGKNLKNASLIAGSDMIQTDSEGNFTFSGKANQLVEITAYCEGYQPLNMKHRFGFKRGPLIIGLKRAFSQLEGKIVNLQSGKPVEGARVQVGKKYSVTDQNGYYKITGLTPTWTQLSVSASGYMETMEVLFVGQNSSKRDVKLRKIESQKEYPAGNNFENNEQASTGFLNAEEEEMLTESALGN